MYHFKNDLVVTTGIKNKKASLKDIINSSYLDPVHKIFKDKNKGKIIYYEFLIWAYPAHIYLYAKPHPALVY